MTKGQKDIRFVYLKMDLIEDKNLLGFRTNMIYMINQSR